VGPDGAVAMSGLQEYLGLARSALQAGRWEEVPRLYGEATEAIRQDAQMKEMLAYALFVMGRYAELLNIEGIDRDSRMWVLSQDLAGSDLAGQHRLVWYGPPLPQVAYVSMVKDEEDIIFINLLWHYSLGFRRFVLIDNLSTDNTRGEIGFFAATFKDAVVIVMEDPIVGHLQSEFTTAGFRVACSLWPEVAWVFPIDADEFLCAEKPLGGILAVVPETVNALLLPKAQYAPTREFYALEKQQPMFRRFRYRERLSHNSSKIVVRSHPFLEIGQGNHVATFRGQDIKSYAGGLRLGLHYREYFLRSQEHARKKVINGGRAIEAAEAMGKKDVGGDHWKIWYRIYQEGGESAIISIFESHHRHVKDLIDDPLPMGSVVSRWL